MTVTALDLPIIAGQLGRDPATGLHPMSRVVSRCPWALPAVVECLPYDQDGRPFPTLFYATCPTLNAAVGLLESAGGVAEVTELVRRDAELRASLHAAERHQRRRRRELARGLAAAGFARAADGGALLGAGIAGTAPSVYGASIKCLHAHAAHALAVPSYTLGATILEQAALAAGSIWCDDARCQQLPALTPDPGRETTTVAAVDLGTNTCRLMLGEGQRSACGPLRVDHRETRVVRLGQGVDKTGRLHPDAVARARACLADYAARIEAYAPQARALFSTSALRDAADGREFLEAVRRDFSLPWRILSGEEEGTLAFRGAACGARGLEGVLLVLDIGGGSTEFAVGRAPRAGDSPDRSGASPSGGGSLTDASGGPSSGANGCFADPPFVRSLDIGAVRLTERFFRHDPPTVGEWTAAVRYVRRLIVEQIPVGRRGSAEIGIGLAGTIATLCTFTLELTEFRRELIEGHPLALGDVERAIACFRQLTSAERLRLPGVQPGREDVILAGALIAREACRAFSLPGLRYASHDVLEGQALELAWPCLPSPGAGR